MKTRHIALSALLAAALAGAADAAITTYTVPKTAAPPTLDGGLDDPCWKSALAITDFGPLGRAKAPAEIPPTTAWLAYDSDYLYLAYRCGEPMAGQMRIKTTEHDGSTWNDDCVEIFLNPSGDRRRYLQIVVNASGVVMDGYYDDGPTSPMDRAYETGMEAKTRIGKDEWTLETRIPFAGLPLAGPSGPWTFHLARTRAAAGQHLTALRSITAGFHDVVAFDVLEGIDLSDRPAFLTGFSLGDALRGVNIASAEVRNFGKEPVTVELLAGVESGAPASPKPLTIAPGQAASAEIPWPLTPADKGKRASLQVRAGPRLLAVRSIVLPAPPDVFGALRVNALYMPPHAPAVVQVPIRIAQGSRPGSQVKWTLLGLDGAAVANGITSLSQPDATLRVYWTHWTPGRYTLKLDLLQDNAPTVSAERALLLTDHPWGE